jgi:tetratricopeptide (TPR) repeat protein
MRCKIFAITLLVFLLFSCSKSPERLGDEAYEKQDYALAIRYYMEALNKKPGDERIKNSLSNARINYARKFFIEARSGLHQSVEEWEILAQHLEEEGEKYRIDLLEVYYAIAKMYIEKGNSESALKYLKKAVIVEPVKKIAIGKIFDIFANIPDDKLESNIQTFLDENKDDLDICMKSAAFLAQRNRLERAIQVYDRCINLSSSKPALREQINMERDSVVKRLEREKDKKGHQPGQWESGDNKR